MGLFSGIFGSRKSKTEVKTDPWGPQQDPLERALGTAEDIYGRRSARGFNSDQQRALDMLRAFATGQQGKLAGSVFNAANRGLQSGPQFGRNAQSIFQSSQGSPFQRAQNEARGFAQGPLINRAIDASLRDVNRNLTENVLPGISQAASLTGNTNSSRTGIAQGIALRGAQDRAADIAAQMRYGALQDALGYSMQGQGMQAGQQLAANQQLGDYYNTGLQAAPMASHMGTLGPGILQSVGDARDRRQQDLFNEYFSLISTPLGSQGTQYAPRNSMFQEGIGTAALLGSVFLPRGLFGGS